MIIKDYAQNISPNDLLISWHTSVLNGWKKKIELSPLLNMSMICGGDWKTKD